ncbi:MAG: hypothetical protein AB1641_09625 [Thermodesulfobacteriota bacterium]
MLDQRQRAFLYDRARVPEQLPDYVTAVSGAEPFLFEQYLFFRRGGHLLFIGYPLDEAAPAMPQAFENAVRQYQPRTAALIAPGIWLPPNRTAEVIHDFYFELTLPLAKPRAELAYMVRRAGREVVVNIGSFGREHEEVIGSFLSARPLDQGYKTIYEAIPRYLEKSSTARLLEARRLGRLAAFNILDLGSFRYGFYMFNFRSREVNVPGASDLLFQEMARLAHQEGKQALNLGLGINPGVKRFKEKWGARAFLPYASTMFRPGPRGLKDLIRNVVLSALKQP